MTNNDTTMIALVSIIALVGIIGLLFYVMSKEDKVGGIIIKETEDGYMIFSVPSLSSSGYTGKSK